MKSTIMMALATASMAVAAYASIHPDLSVYEHHDSAPEVSPRPLSERQSCQSSLNESQDAQWRHGLFSVALLPD